MLHYIANRFASVICENSNLSSETKQSVYVYGFELLLSTIFSASSILIISAVLDKFLWGLVFLIIFVLFRMVCGGYHAKTYARCYWSSMLTFLCVLVAAQYSHSRLSILLICVFYSVVIFMWAPQINIKHPLSENAKKKNRKCAVLLVIFTNIWIGYMVSINQISDFVCVVATSIAAVAVLMIIAKKHERRKTHECLDSDCESC